MKIARYLSENGTYYGLLEESGNLLRLAGSPFEGIELKCAIEYVDDVRILAPFEASRIFGVGFNYVSHIKEGGGEAPQMAINNPT